MTLYLTLILFDFHVHRAKPENHMMIQMGDINDDNLKIDGNTRKFNILSGHGMQRLNLPATRITHLSSTSMDSISSNLQNMKMSPDLFDFLNYILQSEDSHDVHQAHYVVFTMPSWKHYLNTFAETKNNLQKNLTKKLTYFSHNNAHRLKADLYHLNQFEISGNVKEKKNALRLKTQSDQRLKQLRKTLSKNIINGAENETKTLSKLINRVANCIIIIKDFILTSEKSKLCRSP